MEFQEEEFQEDSEGVHLFSPNLELRTMNRKCSRQQWLRKHINKILGRPRVFW